MGRFGEKIKGLFQKGDENNRNLGKLFGILGLIVGNVMAASAMTIAWFNIINREANIDTVAGDLNVEIKKVSAYKYIYPYYSNSAEFINYDGEGEVLSFVMEDQNYPEADFEDSITITLGDPYSGTYITSGTGTKESILYPTGSSFFYYLLGDSVFSGTTSEWSIDNSVPFSYMAAPTANNPAILDNVVVSAGAEFTLFDARTATAGSCNYLNYASADAPSEGKSKRFEILSNKTLRCLSAGIYSFSYTGSSLTITLHNRNNDAVIGSNILDPTKISLDYYATGQSGTLNDYVPTAIKNQNTMVVLDVELAYRNASEIDAGLQVKRLANTAFDYTDSENTVGYINEQQQNALKASDFYAFYPCFSEGSLGSASEVWEALHQKKTNDTVNQVNIFSKFDGTGTVIDAPLYSDTLTVNAGKITLDASSNSTYHCYIAIDYDYIHTLYFLNENRLGKTYRLDRDFGFYFTATQHMEASE
ncbi:MAG: hypothetical protein K6B65_00110 [Bacilli bacterium]|nr:hypothetical protein [Bacilli bacterium]